jgi:hypothetical protein
MKPDYDKLTWKEMAETVAAFAKEMKRRNPIGVNLYVPIVRHAAELLDDISTAESVNFTCETGPKEPKRSGSDAAA